MSSFFLRKAKGPLTVLQSEMAKAGPMFLSPTQQRDTLKGKSPSKAWIIKALKHKKGVLVDLAVSQSRTGSEIKWRDHSNTLVCGEM